jgi:hypothetical protein
MSVASSASGFGVIFGFLVSLLNLDIGCLSVYEFKFLLEKLTLLTTVVSQSNIIK